jgi:hypothetical protein
LRWISSRHVITLGMLLIGFNFRGNRSLSIRCVESCSPKELSQLHAIISCVWWPKRVLYVEFILRTLTHWNTLREFIPTKLLQLTVSIYFNSLSSSNLYR